MPIVYDLEKDIRYQQGEEKGMEKGLEVTAINMIKNNYTLEDIRVITGLSIPQLQKLADSISKEK